MSVKPQIAAPSSTRTDVMCTAKQWLSLWYRPVLCILVGFFACGGVLFDTMRPLGLCLVIAVPACSMFFAALGAAAGYTFFTDLTTAAPYLCAIVVVASLRFALSWKKRENTAVWAAAAGAVGFWLVRTGLCLLAEQPLSGVLMAFSEAVIVVGSSYLLTAVFEMKTLVPVRADGEQMAAICFLVAACFICIAPYRMLGLAPARVMAGFWVLFAAWRYGAAQAAVMAAVCSAAFCVSDESLLFAAAGIAAGGLMAGFFADQRRWPAVFAFCSGGFIGAVSAPTGFEAGLFLAELTVVGGLFLLVPRRLLERTGAYTAQGIPASVRTYSTALAARLQALSNALSDVGETVQSICAKMARRSPEVPLADLVIKRCCRDCARRFSCWVDHAEDCYRAFADWEQLLIRGAWVESAELPEPLGGWCIQPQKLCAAVYACHMQRSELRGAAMYDRVTRAALCEQYGALAASLGALAGEMSLVDLPDPRKSVRLYRLFRDLGLEPSDAQVAHDAHGRLTAAVCVAPIAFSAQELEALCQEVSALCRRSFALPEASEAPSVTMLTFRETPRFHAEFGVCGLPAYEGAVSADAARAFFCTGGYACAVLCDGMGTGKAAAVDGIMAAQLASELLKAGFEPQETARMVNVSLAMKNGSALETATTIDILKVDLYSGEVVLFKAGAAPSFVVRKNAGTVDVYRAESVPLGILDKVLGRTLRLKLNKGDTAVLASDGVCTANATEFCAILSCCEQDDAVCMAHRAAHDAKKYAKEADDITVVTIQLLSQ